MKYVLMDLKVHGDCRGALIALESQREVPFEVKRVYYIFGTKPNVRRGYHAHKRLEQLLVCVSGSCVVHLDDGQNVEEIVLDDPAKGLYVSNDVWREMYDFSEDAVLLVLASELYDETDYIRDYQQFIAYLENR